jgi:hypothetical protein
VLGVPLGGHVVDAELHALEGEKRGVGGGGGGGGEEEEGGGRGKRRRRLGDDVWSEKQALS